MCAGSADDDSRRFGPGLVAHLYCGPTVLKARASQILNGSTGDSGMGHGAWDMGHGAWDMGHGAWGMGHGAWGMGHGAWGSGLGIGDWWSGISETALLLTTVYWLLTTSPCFLLLSAASSIDIRPIPPLCWKSDVVRAGSCPSPPPSPPSRRSGDAARADDELTLHLTRPTQHAGSGGPGPFCPVTGPSLHAPRLRRQGRCRRTT